MNHMVKKGTSMQDKYDVDYLAFRLDIILKETRKEAKKIVKQKLKILEIFNETSNNVKIVVEYERNRLFIENIISKGDFYDQADFIPIKLTYVNSLIQVGRFTDALSVVESAISQLEEMDGNWSYHKDYRKYSIFLKGVGLGRLKKYKESNVLFKSLISQEPNNDIYAEWFRGNQIAIIRKLFFPILVVSVSFYFILIGLEFLGYESPFKMLRTISIGIGLFSFLIPEILSRVINKTHSS